MHHHTRHCPRLPLITASALAALLTLAAGAASGTAFAHGGDDGGRTLYVSPSGHDVTGDEHGSKEHPFKTISFAVQHAHSGATVIVERGTYHEQVNITKRLTVRGTGDGDGNWDDAIINASGFTNGIVVSGAATAGTTLRGLTVQNALQAGVIIERTTRVTVEHNLVRRNDQATPADAGTNQADNPDFEALHLITVTNSLVGWNTVENNKDGGIYLTNEFGATTGNRVIGNRVFNNAVDCGITLASHAPGPGAGGNRGVSYNLVLDNVSNGNGAAGIIVAVGAPTGWATGNRVQDNTARNNGLGGIDIHAHAAGDNASNNTIRENHISGNAPDFGFTSVPTGISIEGDSGGVIVHPVVVDNVITNETYGISLINVSNPVIEDNRISATVRIHHG